MKIKLDNMSEDRDCVLVTTDSCKEARDDQTIMGSRWECDGEGFAYTLIDDSNDLVPKLKEEGYEVDVSEYCPPDLRAGDEDRCPECGSKDPFHPDKPGCGTCRAMASDEVEYLELQAGWDPTP